MKFSLYQSLSLWSEASTMQLAFFSLDECTNTSLLYPSDHQSLRHGSHPLSTRTPPTMLCFTLTNNGKKLNNSYVGKKERGKKKKKLLQDAPHIAYRSRSADHGHHAGLLIDCQWLSVSCLPSYRQFHMDRKTQWSTRALSSTMVVHRQIQANSCQDL